MSDHRPILELDRASNGGSNICVTEFRADGVAIRSSVLCRDDDPYHDATMRRRFDDMARLMGDNVVPLVTEKFTATERGPWVNTPSTDPILRSHVGEHYTYRPDEPPYQGDDPDVVVANGMTVVIVEVFERWNNIDDLTIFAVRCIQTGRTTHVTPNDLHVTNHQELRAA